MLDPVETVERMAGIRDSLLAVVEEHEQTTHDGGPCWPTRANAVGFLSHCLGLTVTDLGLAVAGYLREYDLACERLGCCRKEGGSHARDA